MSRLLTTLVQVGLMAFVIPATYAIYKDIKNGGLKNEN
jgi:hypothetical protein